MKTNIFKYIFFIIVVILICIAIYILYKDIDKQKNDIQDNIIKFNIIKEMNIGITDYDTINPVLSNNRDIQYVNKLIFQPLLNITHDFKIENLLTKEFSKIDSTTYIAKLRDDVYWHDGTKFTAKDVIFTVNNLKKDNINSIYKENVSTINEIEQIDDYTIKILLKEEVPFFEYRMCFPILASHSYEPDTLNSKTSIPIGTGKYKIESIEENLIKIALVDNKSESKIRNINLVLKESINELYNAFSKNEIDYMITDNIEYEEYIGTMGYNLNQVTNREYEYLALNTEDTILSNKEIRKAISYAIDKKNINYNMYSNKYIESGFPLDYGSYLYNQNKLNEYNINETKRILSENGWTYKNNTWKRNGKKLEFKLIVNSNNEKRVLLAEQIKEQLKQVGIVINIIKVSDSSYTNYVKYKNYDMILTGNIISTCPNLETYFGEDNLSNFSNEEIKNILKDVKNINDVNVLTDKYSNIAQIYKEEMPFISLYSNSLFILSNNNLKGDLSCNWYNLFYNIDNWYKIQ
ncbi:MAG: hypothetical protein IJB90_00485 [Clostridia bacterium]|nr:hypothetical protein [Clostridia bacterium]